MSRKIRLLVVGPTPPPFHGVATFIRDLLAAQHPRVETLHLDTSDRRDTDNTGRWDPTNLQLGFANLSDLAARSLRADVDAVYVPISQNVPAFLRDALFILEARALGKKVIIHLHGGYFRTLYEQQNAVFQAAARGALNCAAAVLVLGKEFVPIFAGLVPDEKIHVVENGVPDSGAWDLRETSGGQTGIYAPVPPATLLYMGTLTRTKGVLALVQALAILRATRPTLRLRVAGRWAEDDLRSETEACIARENLLAHVDFVGNVDGASKAEFLASGTLFCLPTRYPYEGQPLVLLEAMAAGLPILSTQHGAIASTVLGTSGRLLIKECTPQQIAAALDDMLNDENALRAMSSAARRRYLEHYTLQACHERLFKIVEAACSPVASKS